MSEQDFLLQLVSDVHAFQQLRDRHWVLLHHNDADGLTSGSILGRMFERLGLRIQRYVLEKPYPEVLATIFSLAEDDPSCAFMFADFASGMLRTLVELNSKGSALFVLDHHSIQPPSAGGTYPRWLRLVNPRAFALSGDSVASAATVCALFAHAVSAMNADLASLGIVGAVGDRQIAAQESPDQQQLSLLHTKVLALAQQSGQLQAGPGEWLLKSKDTSGSTLEISVTALVEALDALGSFGYYANGVDLALKGLADGFDQRYQQRATQLRQDWLQKCGIFFASSNAIQQAPGFDFFELDASFYAMGVKTVGLCAEWLFSSQRCSPQQVLLGFQRLRSDLPGLGHPVHECYKVSARVGSAVAAAIDQGHARPLSESLAEAALEVGGFVDAGHARAAACTIPFTARAAFLQAFSRARQGRRE